MTLSVVWPWNPYIIASEGYTGFNFSIFGFEETKETIIFYIYIPDRSLLIGLYFLSKLTQLEYTHHSVKQQQHS